MIDSVHTLMKSLTPHVKMINMKKSNVNELKTGLLDGGATNALRVGTAQELADAVPVQVELAAGTAQLFQDPNTGTLLTKEAVEPIVPLRGLINLGYRIQWDTNGCVIEHGKHGRIKCWLRNGCPVVLENHALLLIDEIEGYERFQRLGPKIAMGQVTEEVMEWWSQRFPLVPESVVQYMVGQGESWDSSQLPWNRKMRKRFQGAKGLVIHLFAGGGNSCKDWEKGWPSGYEMVAIDIQANPQMDIHNRHVWAYLTWLVQNVPVVGIVGGPPCRTVSRLRNIQPGPAPLRWENRFGLPSMSQTSKLKTDSDSEDGTPLELPGFQG